MHRLQKWFETLTGLPSIQHDQWLLSQEIFAKPATDTKALQTPACWRRKPTYRRFGAR